jgi:hypothetical protein
MSDHRTGSLSRVAERQRVRGAGGGILSARANHRVKK